MIALTCALLLACGGSTTETDSSYAGTYQTAVTLTSNSCSGITVQNQPTVITHVAGASALSLRHAGLDYSGTVDPDGSFRAAVTGSGASPCEYVVHWIGTK